MTEEEFRQKLADLGITPGEWGEREETGPHVPPLLQAQADVITKIRDEVLQPQISQYQAQIQALNEKVARLKHGGGR